MLLVLYFSVRSRWFMIVCGLRWRKPAALKSSCRSHCCHSDHFFPLILSLPAHALHPLSSGLACQTLALSSTYNLTFPRFQTGRAKERVMNSPVYLEPQSVCQHSILTQQGRVTQKAFSDWWSEPESGRVYANIQ